MMKIYTVLILQWEVLRYWCDNCSMKSHCWSYRNTHVWCSKTSSCWFDVQMQKWGFCIIDLCSLSILSTCSILFRDKCMSLAFSVVMLLIRINSLISWWVWCIRYMDYIL